MRRQLTIGQQGFTIVELLLAMALFSFILLAVSSGVIKLIQIYTSGVGIRNTQQFARNFSEQFTQTARPLGVYNTDLRGNATIISDTSQSIATSEGDQAVHQDVVCVYSSRADGFAQGTMFYTLRDGATSRFDLYKTTVPTDGASCARPASTSGSQRLNPDTVSVAVFQAVTTGSLIDLNVTAMATTGLQSDDLVKTGPYPVNCRPQVGDQFCAITNVASSVNFRGVKYVE